MPLVSEEERSVSSSSDEEDDEMPALRVSSIWHSMTLHTRPPPPGSHRDTFEKEFQYLQKADLSDTSTPNLERKEQTSCMSRIVHGIITREAEFFKTATRDSRKSKEREPPHDGRVRLDFIGCGYGTIAAIK